MAWFEHIWKIYGIPKISLYLERFELKHATAHIHQRCASAKKQSDEKNNFLYNNSGF